MPPESYTVHVVVEPGTVIDHGGMSRHELAALLGGLGARLAGSDLTVISLLSVKPSGRDG